MGSDKLLKYTSNGYSSDNIPVWLVIAVIILNYYSIAIHVKCCSKVPILYHMDMLRTVILHFIKSFIVTLRLDV